MKPHAAAVVASLLVHLSFNFQLCFSQMDNNISTNGSSVPCRNPIVSSTDKNSKASVVNCPSGYGLGNAIGGCRDSLEENVPSSRSRNFINATNDSNRPNGSTVCVLCEVAVSFRNGVGPGTCKPCTSCGEDAIEVSSCNGTHDAQCRCPRGKYYETYANNDSSGSNLAIRCKQCSVCTHGSGVSKQCTENQDTLCRKCPPGSYSEVISGYRDCAPCTVCKEDQIMLQECNRIQDTICIDKNSNKRHQFPPTPSDSRSVQAPSESGGDVSHRFEDGDIPVYCTILLPVALGILVYVLLKWRMRHSSKTPHHGLRGDSSPAAFRQDILLLGGASPVSHITPQKYNSQVKMHINELSTCKRRDLEAALNVNRTDGKDWRGLAKHLGYSKQETFETLANQNGQGPAFYLLSDWSKMESSTLEVLSLALMELGRIDIVWMLQPTCQKMFPPAAGGEMV